MSQHAEPSPHSRSAIISDLAGVISEVAVLQERQAALNTATAAVQGRLAEMVRTLSQSTAIPAACKLTPAEISRVGELLQRPSGVSAENVAAAVKRSVDQTNSAMRAALATQAASPPGASPVVQAEGQPVQVGKGSDAIPEGVPGKSTSGQSEQFGACAGAGGESAASADTAPAADAKPKRTFPQPLPEKQQAEPATTPREPRVLTAGGGLVQDGGSAKPKSRGDEVLDLWAETTLTQPEIAAKLKINSGTPSAYLSTARRAQDPRALKGDAARKITLAAGSPADVRKTANPIPENLVIAVLGDEMVHGPTGSWRADPKVAKALAAIADGSLFGFDRIADAGGFKESTVVASLGIWASALAKIGVDLVHTKGIGVKLNRATVTA